MDIDLEKTKKCVNAYFGPILKNAQPIRRTDAKEDHITQEIYPTYEDKNHQVSAVVLAYRIPKKTNKDAYVLKIIENVLSNGESSRIARNVVNKKTVSLLCEIFPKRFKNYSVFIVYAVVNSDVPWMILHKP